MPRVPPSRNTLAAWPGLEPLRDCADCGPTAVPTASPCAVCAQLLLASNTTFRVGATVRRSVVVVVGGTRVRTVGQTRDPRVRRQRLGADVPAMHCVDCSTMSVVATCKCCGVAHGPRLSWQQFATSMRCEATRAGSPVHDMTLYRLSISIYVRDGERWAQLARCMSGSGRNRMTVATIPLCKSTTSTFASTDC